MYVNRESNREMRRDNVMNMLIGAFHHLTSFSDFSRKALGAYLFTEVPQQFSTTLSVLHTDHTMILSVLMISTRENLKMCVGMLLLYCLIINRLKNFSTILI